MGIKVRQFCFSKHYLGLLSGMIIWTTRLDEEVRNDNLGILNTEIKRTPLALGAGYGPGYNFFPVSVDSCYQMNTIS